MVEPTEPSEHIGSADQARDLEADWRRDILSKYGGRCANCGSQDRVRPKLIVPIQAGGQYKLSNGVLLCRVCDMTSAARSKGSGDSEENRRAVTISVSRGFHEGFRDALETRNGFGSMSAVARFMVSTFIQDPSRFDDLENYQDEGQDTRLNLWIGLASYTTFRSIIAKRGLTVTEALKALILMYQDQTDLKKEHN